MHLSSNTSPTHHKNQINNNDNERARAPSMSASRSRASRRKAFDAVIMQQETLQENVQPIFDRKGDAFRSTTPASRRNSKKDIILGLQKFCTRFANVLTKHDPNQAHIPFFRRSCRAARVCKDAKEMEKEEVNNAPMASSVAPDADPFLFDLRAELHNGHLVMTCKWRAFVAT